MKLHLFPSRSLAVSDTELLRRVWAWYLPSLAWLVASSEIQWKLMSLHRRYQSKSSLYRSCPGNKTWNEKLDDGFLSRSPTRLQLTGIDQLQLVTCSTASWKTFSESSVAALTRFTAHPLSFICMIRNCHMSYVTGIHCLPRMCA